MSLVNVVNVTVLNNPGSFTSPFQFQIQFECLQDLPEDIEWKLTYVGDAENPTEDQVLEDVSVGPVVKGVHMFVFQSPPPQPDRIKNRDLIGVTVILLTCSYLEQQFVQIGYYVNNEYAEPFEPENYPNPVDINLINRNILADEPRVTCYAIDWTGQAPITENGVVVMENNTGEDVVNEDDMVEDDVEVEDDEDEDEDEEEEDENLEIDIDLEDDEDDEEDDDDEMEQNSGEEEEGGDVVGDDVAFDHEMARDGAMVMINEDSMDVHAMMTMVSVEQATHSHSHSHSFSGRDYI